MNNRAYRARRLAAGVVIRTSAPAIRRIRSESLQYHFDAESYLAEITSHVPRYEQMQGALARATEDVSAGSVLDLGTGTGETAAAVLEVHPSARLTGVDASAEMLEVARRRLPSGSIDALIVAKLEEFEPANQFDLVVSSLAVHHLTARQKRGLFSRIYRTVSPGGRFVLADVIRAERPADAVTPISRVYDRPERAVNLERWLHDAGFHVSREWTYRDLVVLKAARESNATQDTPSSPAGASIHA